MTAEDAALAEPESVSSVWMPLAAAQILQVLIFIATAFQGDGGKMKVPKTSEALRGFGLPMMADAAAEDERELDALAMMESIKDIGRRTGAKVDVKTAEK